MKKILNYFLQGLLYIVPISVTIFVVVYALNKIADILPIKNTFVSLIVLFALITIIGMVGSKLIASPFNALFKKILDKLTYNDLFETIDMHMSDKNIGARKNQRPLLKSHFSF